jgi:hypothetical protein
MVRYALRALGQYRMDKSGDLAYYEELAKERARAEVLRVKQAEVRNPGLFDTAVFGLEFKAAQERSTSSLRPSIYQHGLAARLEPATLIPPSTPF